MAEIYGLGKLRTITSNKGIREPIKKTIEQPKEEKPTKEQIISSQGYNLANYERQGNQYFKFSTINGQKVLVQQLYTDQKGVYAEKNFDVDSKGNVRRARIKDITTGKSTLTYSMQEEKDIQKKTEEKPQKENQIAIEEERLKSLKKGTFAYQESALRLENLKREQSGLQKVTLTKVETPKYTAEERTFGRIPETGQTIKRGEGETLKSYKSRTESLKKQVSENIFAIDQKQLRESLESGKAKVFEIKNGNTRRLSPYELVGISSEIRTGKILPQQTNLGNINLKKPEIKYYAQTDLGITKIKETYKNNQELNELAVPFIPPSYIYVSQLEKGKTEIKPQEKEFLVAKTEEKLPLQLKIAKNLLSIKNDSEEAFKYYKQEGALKSINAGYNKIASSTLALGNQLELAADYRFQTEIKKTGKTGFGSEILFTGADIVKSGGYFLQGVNEGEILRPTVAGLAVGAVFEAASGSSVRRVRTLAKAGELAFGAIAAYEAYNAEQRILSRPPGESLLQSTSKEVGKNILPVAGFLGGSAISRATIKYVSRTNIDLSVPPIGTEGFYTELGRKTTKIKNEALAIDRSAADIEYVSLNRPSGTKFYLEKKGSLFTRPYKEVGTVNEFGETKSLIETKSRLFREVQIEKRITKGGEVELKYLGKNLLNPQGKFKSLGKEIKFNIGEIPKPEINRKVVEKKESSVSQEGKATYLGQEVEQIKSTFKSNKQQIEYLTTSNKITESYGVASPEKSGIGRGIGFDPLEFKVVLEKSEKITNPYLKILREAEPRVPEPRTVKMPEPRKYEYFEPSEVRMVTEIQQRQGGIIKIKPIEKIEKPKTVSAYTKVEINRAIDLIKKTEPQNKFTKNPISDQILENPIGKAETKTIIKKISDIKTKELELPRILSKGKLKGESLKLNFGIAKTKTTKASKQSQKSISDQIQRSLSKQIQNTVSKQSQKSISDQIQRSLSKQIQNTVSKQSQKSISETVQKSITKGATDVGSGFRVQIPTGITRTPPPQQGLPLPRLKKGVIRNDGSGWNVYVKQGKESIKVNKKPLFRGSAEGEAAYYLDNTASKTATLKKSNRRGGYGDFPLYFNFNRRKFTEKGDKIREKNKYGIDTFGELKGITAKGLRAIRNKKKSYF